MKFFDLLEGRLIKRHKRFLADVELLDGSIVIAHCPNTGAMKNCAEPGSRVWLNDVNDPRRKLRYTWELVESADKALICINTQRANQLVKEALEQGLIEPLARYPSIRPEAPYGQENSRIDFLLTGDNLPDCYLEVKNLTLCVGGGIGLFPDAVTERGRKHLRELMGVVRQGDRAVLLFNVAHTAINRVSPAWEIDPAYGQTLMEALAAGVEVLAYGVKITPGEMLFGKAMFFNALGPYSLIV